MKNKGYTLLEILIAVAMLAIFATLLMPLGTAFTKSHNKMTEINELDLELSKTAEIIKRSIRAAQDDDVTTNGAIAILEPADSLTATSSALTLIINDGSNYQYVRFWYDEDNRIDGVADFYVTTTTNAAIATSNIGGSVLVSDVESVEFRFYENIVTMYFKLTKGGLTREIRDAGVTRIDYQISKKVTF